MFNDITEHLQQELDSHKSVTVPAGEWVVTKPIVLHSERTLVLNDAMIVGRGDGFTDKQACLLEVFEVHDIVVGGGQLRLEAPDVSEKDEHRHAIGVFGSENVVLDSMSCTSNGGDGVYVGGGLKTEKPSRDVRLLNVRCIDNHRNACSVTGVDRFRAEQCVFGETHGSKPRPKSGMCLEPNRPNDPMNDILVKCCTFGENSGSGMMVNLSKHNKDSQPASIKFRNCNVESGHGPTFIGYSGEGHTGSVRFYDCEFRNVRYPGVLQFGDQQNRCLWYWSGCTWSSVARNYDQFPIDLSQVGGDAGRYIFNQCRIFDRQERSFIKPLEKSTLTNVQGNIKVPATSIDSEVLRRFPMLRVEAE